jgi:hypothetical protein
MVSDSISLFPDTRNPELLEIVRKGHGPFLEIYFHGGFFAISTDVFIYNITCI